MQNVTPIGEALAEKSVTMHKKERHTKLSIPPYTTYGGIIKNGGLDQYGKALMGSAVKGLKKLVLPPLASLIIHPSHPIISLEPFHGSVLMCHYESTLSLTQSFSNCQLQ